MTYEWILRLVHSIECQQTDEKSYNRQRKYSSNTQITVSSESCSDENRKDEEERRQTFFFFCLTAMLHIIYSPIWLSLLRRTLKKIFSRMSELLSSMQRKPMSSKAKTNKNIYIYMLFCDRIKVSGLSFRCHLPTFKPWSFLFSQDGIGRPNSPLGETRKHTLTFVFLKGISVKRLCLNMCIIQRCFMLQ